MTGEEPKSFSVAVSELVRRQEHVSASTSRVLDAVRLTVLGVLIGLGATVGLSVGFQIGGVLGAVVGVLSGLAAPLALAVLFRWPTSREWLARLADWAIRSS